MNFSENLKHCRERVGYTQAELAKLVGVAQPTYAKYETGAKAPTIFIALKIAEKLGTTCEELVKGERRTS